MVIFSGDKIKCVENFLCENRERTKSMESFLPTYLTLDKRHLLSHRKLIALLNMICAKQDNSCNLKHACCNTTPSSFSLMLNI